ncbi:MAG: Ig-like domain-containing protein [Bacteroidota bacterium]
MKRLLFLSLPLLAFACIGDDFLDDFVQPEIRIASTIDSLTIDSSFQLTALYFNNVGIEEVVPVSWSSSDPAVVSVDNSGLVTAHTLGTAELTVNYSDGNNPVTASTTLHTAENPVEEPELQSRMGVIRTTSSYVLRGDFTLDEQEDGSLLLDIADNYAASTALPGLYIYLSNNPNSTSNALEIGPVAVFSGAHAYTITETMIDQYSHVLYFCKPFNVKVGDGEILVP